MKHYILFILIMICSSCTDKEDDIKNFNFKIENTSEVNLVIKSYDSQNPSVVKRTIVINNNASFSETYSSRESDRTYIMEDVLKGDSIVISYNNDERKEIYTCIDKFGLATGCSENRNLISFNTSTNQSNNINTIYTFITSDYNDAND